MKVLVLGGTGFAGPHVVRELAAAGHEVTVFHRRAGQAPAGVAEVVGDRRNLEASADPLHAVGAEVVVDMLCMSRKDACGLLGLFGKTGTRLVVASSQDVYRAFGVVARREAAESIENRPITEDSALRETRFVHGRTQEVSEDEDYEKIFVEEHVRAARPDATFLRMPATYGPNDPQQRVWPFLHQMEQKRPAILLNPDYAHWRWTHGYVENVAHAFVLAATHEQASGQVYNVGEAKTPTVGDRVHQIARVARFRGLVLALPKDRVPRHLAMEETDFRQDLVISSDKIRRDLGYSEVVSVEEGLKRTVEWDRQHAAEYRGPKGDLAVEDDILRSLGVLKK